jgi:hypothetical protein
MRDSTNQAKVTVMCFFASDNALSPLLISQMKAIKDAGYEQDTNVLVRFDPHETSAPTRIYHVNAQRREVGGAKTKGKRTLIGDGGNPFVRNMAEDIIDPATIGFSDDDNMSAFESLKNFVDFSRKKCPAEHYMLFLIGHGMIVGNDAFLPDDNPNSGISLTQLETILEPFKEDDKTTLELLGLHSCSMSSVEIAYQLKGLANYMIASQGTSYVGSWPYRQLLKKIFATVDEAEGGAIEIQQLVEKLYHLSLYNSTDFMMAGYSSEMSLCNLQEEIVNGLTSPLQNLIDLLTNALDQNGSDPVKDLIVGLIGRAHAESQSYWGENYTDLYDFCERLGQACLGVNGVMANAKLTAIADACQAVTARLATVPAPDRAERFRHLVVRSEYFGWKFQYSHGLSIFFPWAEPLEVENVSATPVTVAPPPEGSRFEQIPPQASQESIMARYQDYKFSRAFKNGSAWFDFLNSYFKGTQRALRNGRPPEAVLKMLDLGGPSDFETASTVALAVEPDHKPTGEFGPGDNKPTASIGVDGGSSSIKNFSTQVGRNGRKIRAFSISPGALKAFKRPVPAADNAKAVHQTGD